MSEEPRKRPDGSPPRRRALLRADGKARKVRRADGDPGSTDSGDSPPSLRDLIEGMLQLSKDPQDETELSKVQGQNLHELKARVEDIQDAAIALSDWGAWLRQPGRSQLFNRLCRFITPAEWDSQSDTPAAVPWIFGEFPDEFPIHLKHCHHCRLQSLLGAVRYRRRLHGMFLMGDAVVRQFLQSFCPQALSAAQERADVGAPHSGFIRVSEYALHILAPRESSGGFASLRIGDPTKASGPTKDVWLQVHAEVVARKGGLLRVEKVFPSDTTYQSVRLGQETSFRWALERPKETERVYLRYETHAVYTSLQMGSKDRVAGSSGTLMKLKVESLEDRLTLSTTMNLDEVGSGYDSSREVGTAILDWKEP